MKALAVAAGIVFWTLVLGTAWLAFFPGSDSGGPVAILQIEPATAPGADMPAAAPEGAPPPEASESPAPPEPPSQGKRRHGASSGFRRRAVRATASAYCRGSRPRPGPDAYAARAGGTARNAGGTAFRA